MVEQFLKTEIIPQLTNYLTNLINLTLDIKSGDYGSICLGYLLDTPNNNCNCNNNYNYNINKLNALQLGNIKSFKTSCKFKSINTANINIGKLIFGNIDYFRNLKYLRVAKLDFIDSMQSKT